MGSVSLDLATTAECPVAVIRPVEHPGGPLVVGLGNKGWDPVVRFACALASADHAPMRLVHVREKHGTREMHGSQDHGAAGGYDQSEAAKELLDEAERLVRDLSPDRAVETRQAVGSSRAGGLLELSRDARLVVVGGRAKEHGRQVLGSTAHAVLHHAACPVVIVRGPEF